MYKKHTIYLFFISISFVFFSSCEKDISINLYEFQDDSVKVDSLKINNKVLIIGIDGFRSDAMTQEITPSIYEFSQRNVYKNLSHLTEEDTYSGPNWSSILTGVHYNKHNVTDNSFGGGLFNIFPTFFNYIENNVNSINTSSIVNWLPINQKILSKDVDYYSKSQISDSIVFIEALNLLLNNNPVEPDILFLHFDELDAAGHNFGFSPNIIEYRETLKNIDLYVDSLVGIIDNKRLFDENWMCIIVSDHGGDGYSHGDYNNIKIRETVFIVEHPSQNFKLQHKSNMTDIAPTVLDFIGISSTNFDSVRDGQSILE
jgi:predicted AlkP superfamily pyrophosphatase or phosphodiesterase